MTGLTGMKSEEPNWRRFKQACRIAKASPGMTTALITGKGEPTLWPDLITKYLDALEQYGDFPVVELQTNGEGRGRIGYDWQNEAATII